jgi:hypothetical protein
VGIREQVITSFSPAGFRVYGRRMVTTFLRSWPPEIPLVVYADAPTEIPGVEVRLTTALDEWVACRLRWAGDLQVHGKSRNANPDGKPYHYRYDAARFAVKVFAWRDAARRMGAGILTWLDGDTVTTKRIRVGWTEQLLGGADLAYLGRGPMHPENGYVGFRIPEALPVLEWCAEAYSSERFRAIPHGWTDCHILRAALAAVPINAKDLTSHQYAGTSHIWPRSPLAAYVTHHKGQREKRQAIAC